MSQSFRQPEILEIARRDGRVTVEGLAEHFNVTLQTIRRDLTELAEAGRLDRVHGGAVLPSGTVNIGYEHRRTLNPGPKAAIAAACAAEIPDDASIFLNIGTSTEAVARALLRHRGLMVVTNNINVAHILAENAEAQVIVAGGALSSTGGASGSAVGVPRTSVWVSGSGPGLRRRVTTRPATAPTRATPTTAMTRITRARVSMALIQPPGTTRASAGQRPCWSSPWSSPWSSLRSSLRSFSSSSWPRVRTEPRARRIVCSSHPPEPSSPPRCGTAT